MHAYELSAFWEASAKPIDAYAEDLLQLFKAFGATDPRLRRWFDASAPPEAPLERVEDIRDALLRHPEKWAHAGVEYRACTARFANDAPEGGRATIDIVAGIDRPSSSVWFPNRMVIRFWGPGAQNAFRAPDVVVRWLDIVVVLFQPVWAVVGPEKLFRSHSEDLVNGRPVVSWMLFLSSAYGAVAPLPDPSRVVPLRDGVLVVTVPDWFDRDSVADESARRTVQDALDAQGKRPARVAPGPA